MKTAISIPDKAFKKAEKAAKKMGLSRSEFFTRAVEAYTEVTLQEQITEKLNALYSKESSELDPAFIEMQNRSILKDW